MIGKVFNETIPHLSQHFYCFVVVASFERDIEYFITFRIPNMDSIPNALKFGQLSLLPNR